MTAEAMPSAAGSGPWRLPLAAAAAAGLAFVVLQIASMQIAGWVFEYPHDDPYIHLAIAEQIANGTYGVNAGEAAAAASSPLYPVLLTPFAGQPVQRYLPLLWNIAGLLAAAALWGRILWRAGYDDTGWGLAVAMLGPLALNMVGLAHTGMEHMLHTAASLAIVLGLVRFFDEKSWRGSARAPIPAVLILGILCAPLLRFEGAALAILAAGAVAASGRLRAGLGLLVLAILPLALFCGFLVWLGLDPLPSSVRAKLAGGPAEGLGPAGYIAVKLGAVLTERREQILAVLIVLTGLFALLPEIRRSPRWPLLPVIGGAGIAHFFLGRFGWIDRYEIYILVTLSAGLLAAAGALRTRAFAGLVLIPMLMAGALYIPLVLNLYPGAGHAVHVQQAQMARFAKDYLKQPVAVNDLGYVAWANPDYVLDIWGLANADALRLRLDEGARPGWIGDLAAAQNVPFAMVYDHWFHDELGADWRLLGQLSTDVPAVYLGGTLVNFFLTDGQTDPAPYLEKLRAWAKDLPPGASFAFAGPGTREKGVPSDGIPGASPNGPGGGQ